MTADLSHSFFRPHLAECFFYDFITNINFGRTAGWLRGSAIKEM